MQSMKKPNLFWVSAGAPLASVIISTLLVFAFKAQHHGISIVSFLIGLSLSGNYHMQLSILILLSLITFYGSVIRLENYKKV